PSAHRQTLSDRRSSSRLRKTARPTPHWRRLQRKRWFGAIALSNLLIFRSAYLRPEEAVHLSQVAVRPIKFRSLARLPAPRKGEPPAGAGPTEKSPTVRGVLLVTRFTDLCRIAGKNRDKGQGDSLLRKPFILFVLVFPWVTTAPATVVTTAVT